MQTRQDSPLIRHHPFGALETALVEDAGAARREDPSAAEWILVPSRILRRRLRRRLAEAGVPTFNLRVVLYPELAEAVLQRGGDASRTRMPPGADRVILEGVARRVLDGDSHFHPILDHGGFIAALDRSVGDLFHAGVAPEDILKVMRTRGDAPGLDVAVVYLALHRRYAELGMETVAQRIQRAADGVGALPAGALRLYGFTDLNGVQRRMLRALSETRPVTAYVPRGEDPEVGDAGFVEWLESIGFRSEEPQSGNGAPAIGSPAEFAPATSDPAPPLAPAFRCFSAAGERREAEEVVRRILALLRTGAAPGGIGVLYRDAEPYAALFERLLARASVPVESAEPKPLAATRPARALLLLVRAARSNVSRRAVLDFLDAAAFLAPALPERDALALVSRWESWTIDAGITRGRSVWAARLNRLARIAERSGASAEGLDRKAVTLLLELVPPLLDALVDLPRRNRWSDLAGVLADLGDDWLSRDDDWEAVRAVLVEMGRLDDTQEPASSGPFEALLEDRLAAIDAPRPRPDRERVFAGSVMAAQGLRFEHLFLVGLTEKIFPRPARQDPFLPDPLRAHVSGLEGPLPLRRDAAAGERPLFTLAFESGRSRTLSWSRIDPAEARPRLPSLFLLEALSRERGIAVEELDPERDAERVPLDLLAPAGHIARETPADPVPHDPARFIDAWNAIDAFDFDRLIVAAAAGTGRTDRLSGLAAPELDRCLAHHRLRWRTPHWTVADGFITSKAGLDAVARRIGTDRAWSASRLETYAGCPFRFFLQYVLGVERLERPEVLDRISPLDKGSLIHAILRGFLSGHGAELGTSARKQGADRAAIHDDGAARTALHAALAAVARREIARVEADTPVGYPLTWSVDADRLVDDLAAWLDFELDRAGPLVPEAFELAFGGASDRDEDTDRRSVDTPVRLDLPGVGSTAFQGRIDRVDLDREGRRARVIDYKTGKKRDNAVDVELDGGLHLQLPIYLLALRAFFPELTRAKAEYLFLGADPRPVVYEAPGFPDPSPELVKTLGILLSGIRDGRFFACPEKGGGCSPCRFPTVCGVGIEDRYALKKGDARIAAHLELRGHAPAADAEGEE